MKQEYLYIITAIPALLMSLLVWFANRMIKSADDKKISDDKNFKMISDRQNDIFLKVSLVEKDVAVLTEKFKDIEKVKGDLNHVFGKLRELDLK